MIDAGALRLRRRKLPFQLAYALLEHLVLSRKHLRLGLVERGLVSRASEQEVFGHRADAAVPRAHSR